MEKTIIRQNKTKNQRIYSKLQEKYCFGKIELSQGNRSKAIKMLESILDKCKSNYLLSEAIDILNILAKHYNVIEYKYKKAERHFQDYKNLRQTLQAQRDSTWIQSNYARRFRTNKLHDDLAAEAILDYEKLKLVLEQHDTPIIRKDTWLIKIYADYLNNNYLNIIETCLEAMEYYKTDNSIYSGYLDIFETRLVEAYFATVDLKAAAPIINKLKVSLPKNVKWYNIVELEMRFHFKIGNYEQAAKIINSVIDSGNFKKLALKTQERWLLYLLFVNILYESNVQIKQFVPVSNKRFTRVFNRVARDKGGDHVILFIIRVLENKENLSFSRKIIIKYYNENLRKCNKRTKLFLQALVKISDYNFYQTKSIKALEKIIKELRDTNLIVIGSPEIIPYQSLLTIMFPDVMRQVHGRIRVQEMEQATNLNALLANQKE